MLSVFNTMFRTATKTDWDAPAHWSRDDPRKTPAQFRREELRRQQRAMMLTGRMW
ncbi:hypothetical protein [Yoonia sp. 208BN28-4]|uniref:hypothetical protein n=1 Tax=Yoonia sp. 208BN28-4 TaxID=3126505 RepID=UPI0030A7ECA2